ncbi:MAG: hypothetical protein M1376_18805 [Planctomycetes bacterium]|nr:hypothetical protein [Planctomycetota bacterium]
MLAVPGAWAGQPHFEAAVDLKSYYTSNLYHVSEKREDQFDTKNGPGERFHGMEGPGDFVFVPGLDLTWQWDVGKKRDLEVSFGADYFIHARNTIANYLKLGGLLAYDLTRRDTVSLDVDFVPERFWKNLSLEDPSTHLKIFEEARYRHIGLAPHYLHEWNKDWATGIEYQYATRDYEDPFHDRDRRGHTVMGLVAYNGFKHLDVDFFAGYNATATPTGVEFGIPVDRSFEELILGGRLCFHLPDHWKAKVGTKYRIRNYTTDTEADTTYFDRRDNTWTLDTEVGRKLGKDLYIAVLAGYGHRTSNRSDPTITADQVGYTEYRLGLTAEWAF